MDGEEEHPPLLHDSMKLDNEYLIKYYGDRIYDKRFLAGWSEGELIHPNIITQDGLDTVFSYFRRNIEQYDYSGNPINSFDSMDSWEVDNYAAFIGVKTLAFTECDHFPLPGKSEEENDAINRYNYYMRHAISKLGMKKLVVSGDRGNIYYMSEYWKDECILYMYYTDGFLPDDVKKKIDLVYDEFRGILLGYNLDSIILYNIENRSNVLKIDKFKDNNLSKNQKIRIYKIVFDEYERLLFDTCDKYNRANEIILSIDNKLTKSHEIACLGLNLEVHSLK